MKKFKQKIALFLITILVFGRLFTLSVLAEELQGENLPAEVQSVETQANSSQNSSQEANQTHDGQPPADYQAGDSRSENYEEGQNSVGISPTPAPFLEVEIKNEAEVENEVSSGAISGENEIVKALPTPTPSLEADFLGSEEEVLPLSPTPAPSQTLVKSGEAVSVVEVENKVNTTEVNSEVENTTLNVFSDGDLNLASDSSKENIAENSKENSGTLFLASENYAFLENNIVSKANSGQNQIKDGESSLIKTGDAYSVVSVLNQVNTDIVDSQVKVFTINIFGDIEGNIILPEMKNQGGEEEGVFFQSENQALVENVIDSLAISGQNKIENAKEGEIETGNSWSLVNLINFVNTNLVGMNFLNLSINVLGVWQGNFLGWGGFGFQEGGKSLTLSSFSPTSRENCLSSCFGDVRVKNQAVVVNRISSFANSGGNSVVGAEDARIKTGNAVSVVSLFNFINTSIINSWGILGSINIFGSLKGDIGGESYFLPEVTPTPTPSLEIGELPEPLVEEVSLKSDSSPFVREEGGRLEVEQKNNVGEYILPGDTITFFVLVKNPGSGKVYDVHLKISFLKGGKDMGGGIFDLGDIGAKKGAKISVGLVLSKEAKPGSYIARATVWGLTGPGDDQVSAFADSFFKVRGTAIPQVDLGINREVQAAEPKEEVLGALNTQKDKERQLKALLLGLLLSYFLTVSLRERKRLSFSLDSLRSLAAKISSFLS